MNLLVWVNLFSVDDSKEITRKRWLHRNNLQNFVEACQRQWRERVQQFTEPVWCCNRVYRIPTTPGWCSQQDRIETYVDEVISEIIYFTETWSVEK